MLLKGEFKLHFHLIFWYISLLHERLHGELIASSETFKQPFYFGLFRKISETCTIHFLGIFSIFHNQQNEEFVKEFQTDWLLLKTKNATNVRTYFI